MPAPTFEKDMKMDLIQALKDNEKPFGLMTDEMQAGFLKFKNSSGDIEVYMDTGSWNLDAAAWVKFNPICNVYRLRPDYEPEQEYIECKVVSDSYKGLEFNDGSGEGNLALHQAINHPEFAGFKYEGCVCNSLVNPHLTVPWMFSTKNGTLCQAQSLAESLVLVHATHVILRSK